MRLKPLLPLFFALTVFGAENRVTTPVDATRTARVRVQSHPALAAQDDVGPVDATFAITYGTIYLQPGPGLETFLQAQQTPSSPNYHQWLTPEQFGERFGVSDSDAQKITDWLRSEGFTVHDIARGRHWITFSATAEQASHAFHTQLHRYRTGGETHYANTSDISIPAALASVISGVAGLDDFGLQPYHKKKPFTAQPEYNLGGEHFLAPDDLAVIYNVAPLYSQGIDGTGQKLVIVGQTDILLSDMRSYRTRYHLPANDPQVVLYGPDPGFSFDDLPEADLDLQLSGAIARNATIIYVNSIDVRLSAQYAVDQNLAPVISMSYGSCENSTNLSERSVAQQANAQGITWLVASGDSAAATCDRGTPTPQAQKGNTVAFPASLPEVTAVGGTEFNEGSGTFWSSSNSSALSSAKSYIPEQAWNDSAARNALDGGGGGASAVYAKPVWQSGPGVPNDGFRDLPDVSFSSSAIHDGYAVIVLGGLEIYGGTSAASPVFAGMVSLLNQAQAAANPSAPQGLGNINGALYRLAQATSDVFHDVTVGDNYVPCAQASPNCVNGISGFPTSPGYDLATGLGSVNAANLIAEWKTGTTSTLTLNATPGTYAITDKVSLTATVSGNGAVPTGAITFVGSNLELGTVALTPGSGSATATLSVDGILLASGNGLVGATYSGDATFLPSFGTTPITLQLGSTSMVVPSVNPNPVQKVGTVWPYVLTLTESAGVGTTITTFTINGVNNLVNLPSKIMLPNATLSVALQGQNLTVPLNRIFHFGGTDGDGSTWSRDLTVPFVAGGIPLLTPAMSLTVSPTVMQRNPQADPSCQWSQQVTVQELSGYQVTLTGMAVGTSVSLTSSLQQIFGTTRLAAHGALSGKVCFANAASPSNNSYTVAGTAETGTSVSAVAPTTFGSASSGPAAFSASVDSVVIPLASGVASGSATLNLAFGAGSPSWTATVLPASQKWLSLQLSAGSGNSGLTLNASAAGLSPGTYNVTLSLEATDTLPQVIQIPVAMVVGASADISITGVGNAAAGGDLYAPGALVAVYGIGLAPDTAIAAIQPLPFSLVGTSATVNGIAAPLWFVSANQINLQIPYETSAGAAVLSVNNKGKVASFLIHVGETGPGIFAYQGSMVPYASGAAGQTLFGFITGDGDMTPSLATGATTYATTLATFPRSRQTLTMTIGGEPAKIVFDGLVPGLIGVTQVNFTIPADLPPGPTPVVVTVGGVTSPPVNLTITSP